MAALGDAVVIGISPDLPDKLAKFDDKHELGFTLLSDPDHAVADAYGAWGLKKLYGKEYEGVIRSAVLIAPDGTVSHRWPKLSPKQTPTALLDALADGRVAREAVGAYTAANLAPRAITNHRWYHEKFDDYPKKRRAVIPFLL